ncbi:MAG: terminase small subunit, partial [Nitrospira sp.]|nr:terminase small subunit [Nitrospira sp.]
RNVKVQEALQQAQKRLGERAQIKVDQVIEEYRRIAFANIGDVLTQNAKEEWVLRPLSEISPETLAGVEKIFFEETTNKRGEVCRTLHVRMGPKLRALAKLGEHLGFYN